MTPVKFPFTFEGKELEVVESEKDLRVFIESDLTWSKRITDRCSKANKLFGVLCRSAFEVEARTPIEHYTWLLFDPLWGMRHNSEPESIS